MGAPMRKQAETPGMKTCTKCKETLPLSAFAKDKYHSDGLKTRCRSCRNADQSQYWQARLQRQQDKTVSPPARQRPKARRPESITTLPVQMRETTTQYPSVPSSLDIQLSALVGELRAELAHLKSAPSLAPDASRGEPSPFSIEEIRKLRQDVLSLKQSMEKATASNERLLQTIERLTQSNEKHMQTMREIFK